MTKIIKIKDPFQRWNALSDFDSKKECIIISDIKTKLSIENYLLDKKKSLENDSVLRIHEFFENIFYDIKPEWHLVSDSFLAQYFLEFTSHFSDSWMKNLNNPSFPLLYLEQFLPILFHPENSELLKEWFDDKSKSASLRWKHWYYLCQDFFEEMNSKKIIHKSGLKSFLMSELPNTETSFFPKKKIRVDVGVFLDPCDIFILKEFSSKRDVTFLVPDLEKKEFYEDSIDIYKRLVEETPPSCIESISCDKKQTTLFFKEKNETQLAEVKKATVQVRKWLDQGIKESEIVLLSPNIETYWFALQIHLEKENIRTKKGFTAKVLDFSYIKHWLASLNLYLGFLDFPKMEEYSFYKNPKESFSDFYSSYFKITNEKNSMNVLNKIDKKRNSNEKVKGREFIEWALSFLPKEDDSILDFVFQSFQPFLLEVELRWVSWLRLLESEIFSKSKTLLEESSEGISCLSFNAIDSIRGKYVFIMGLDEDSLQIQSLTSLTSKDRESLVSDLGFILPYPHPKEKEYGLLWFLQSSQLKEVIFSFSSTDFSGEILTPSLFYILSDTLFKIEKNKKLDQCLTSWDSQKQQKQLKIVLNGCSKNSKSIQDIESSFKNKDQPYWHKEDLRLSNSRLKTFGECPFKYAVRYLFYIDNEDVIDREVSHRNLGSLVHKLFEQILREESLNLSKERIREIIENIKPTSIFSNEKQWKIIKFFLMKVVHEFLDQEKNKQHDLKYIKPVGLEKEFKAYWNKKTSKLDAKGDYHFSGKIDRIDYNENDQSYLLIDYKPSDSKLQHIKSWVSEEKDKDDFQLLLYAQALEKGLVEGIEGSKVAGVFYYIYKDFSYKGYVEKNSSSVYKIFQKMKIKFDREVLDEAFEQANSKIQNYVDSIEQGIFFPSPKNKSLCKKCSWRKWCRASHLN